MNPIKNISLAYDRYRMRSAERTQSRLATKYAMRRYDGGRISRSTTDWITESNDINRDIRTDKRKLDDRVYDLSKNNTYTRGHILDNKANIIGHEGFTLQVLSTFDKGPNKGDYDDFANDTIEKAFKKWSRRQYCTMSKRLSWLRVQWLIVTQLVLNGEFLVRLHTGLRTKDNPFGFSLELLDPYDIDYIYTGEYGDNVVINGIEINQWREIKAVWMRSGPVKQELYGISGYYGERTRIDISELIYDFDPDHLKQTRGMTPLACAVLSLKAIDRWEDASMVNAEWSAMKMGFLVRSNLEGPEYKGKKKKEGGKDEPENGKYMDMMAGTIEELPWGYDFRGFDPKFPHQQHQSFLKSMLRKVFTGLGVSYNSSANDLEGVNFSSMRSGLQTERNMWMIKQSFLKEALCIPLYEAWLKSALNCGALGDLFPSNYERYIEHYWQGRRWQWVSPKEDVTSASMSEQMGYKSKIDIVNELGGNLEDIFRDRQRQKKLAKKYDCEELLGFLDVKVTETVQVDNTEGDTTNTNTDNAGNPAGSGAKGTSKKELKLAS
jgi:lambda family phage portal protein